MAQDALPSSINQPEPPSSRAAPTPAATGHPAPPSSTDISEVLAAHWSINTPTITVLHGGMTSQAWAVQQGRIRWAVKAVPRDGRNEFEDGLRLAARLEDNGIPAGAPIKTSGGEITIDVGDRVLAVLRWVEGQELTGGTEDELALIGTTLARVHRMLGPTAVGDGEMAEHLDLCGQYADLLDLRPWIRPAVAGAVARVRSLGPETLTWGFVHGDPAPDHFRLDPETGVCGLLDWGAQAVLPLMFDLASAVLYVGGPDRARPMVAGYLDQGALSCEEVERALLPMLEYRWAVQAAYFASRIARNDLTGIDGPAENEKGLEDARRWFARHQSD